VDTSLWNALLIVLVIMVAIIIGLLVSRRRP
jgi:uncharacterized protein YneF (UPF0154 family)